MAPKSSGRKTRDEELPEVELADDRPRSKHKAGGSRPWYLFLLASFPLGILFVMLLGGWLTGMSGSKILLYGGGLALGDDQGDLVAREADNVAAENRLVVVDEPEGVVGHIGRGQHGNDAGAGEGGARVDADDARVRGPGEDDFQAQRLRIEQIARIACPAGDLGQSVVPRQGLADDRRAGHAVPPAARTASKILR